MDACGTWEVTTAGLASSNRLHPARHSRGARTLRAQRGGVLPALDRSRRWPGGDAIDPPVGALLDHVIDGVHAAAVGPMDREPHVHVPVSADVASRDDG